MPFSKSTVFSALAGLATGASLYIVYFRITQELADLKALIVELKEEIAALKENNRSRRNRRSLGVASYAGSSCDDDDDFVDAVAGYSFLFINCLSLLIYYEVFL